MKKRTIRNPLTKRIPRELLGDWKKYLVVCLFLVLVIGFVSGMYVANESMMTSAEAGVEEYKREDGHFELKEPASEEEIAAIESGAMADVKQFYLSEAKEKLDEEFEKAYPQTDGEAYQTVYEDAYDEAWEELQKEVEERYAEAEEDYGLEAPDFQNVPVNIYENFYRNEEEDYDRDGVKDGAIRVYAKTEEINLACLMDGRFPEAEDEIAIDRMHADNVGVEVGDSILVSGKTYQVVGLLAYVNYATLHEKATDLMFDALKFNVAMVTEEGFDRLAGSIHYSYAWRYADAPCNESEEKILSDNFLKVLLTQILIEDGEIEDYVPAYANPAIHFATDDMGSDEAMGGVLLNILIVIIAFIFAVTISNTIVKESQTIGTLRASGYTKGELVRHYLSMPVIVTLFAACLGNLLGYTVFTDVVVSMYYNSYSLPTYQTIWNSEAFVKTTCIPVVLMFLVNLFVIIKMLQHTPLQFLRSDLKKIRRKKAMRLPHWRFLSRFRLRIMFQNVVDYAVLFLGISFIMILLAMAVGMPDTLDYYKSNAENMMFADYQYVLTSYKDKDGNLVTTNTEGAEKFIMTSLLKKSEALDEEVSVYGIQDGSKYAEIKNLGDLAENEVYISSPYADKYNVETGDVITLDEKYENRQYTFTVAGIYDGSQSIAVFLPIENYSLNFELEAEEFSGFLSDTEITDIDEAQIATVITQEDITKMCDQLDHSMGAYMQYFQVLCILLAVVLIYLLTKLIIEKNENAISMTKILGYNNKEIAGLYLLSTTIVLIFSDAVGVLIGTAVMSQVWRIMLLTYSGWYAFRIEPMGYAKMFAFVLIGYLFVMLLDFSRIKKIPMDQALKNAE